ncbi:GLIPR1-like protein 1 isoform X1 [Haliotis rubra]|uniref:GLIPR1-like protein 1 isoform X1 n=2 Tax=Haliotis rubra TaxID=36100 RepID=UPI001EE5B0FB|nr:GLIPR1-like protein 1 isoform X1 [Haliotis rubra]
MRIPEQIHSKGMATKVHIVVMLTFVVGVMSVVDVADVPLPGKRWDTLFRRKRASLDKRGFSVEEKTAIIDLHNHYRRKERATDMTLMVWDESLAQMAQGWAERCVWDHSENRYNRLPQYNYIGENLYAATDLPSAETAVGNWAEEIKYYTFSSGYCSKVCGHYTQVIWAKSYAVGCGIRHCSNPRGLDWSRYGGGYIVVCNYGPGGNIRGRKPYDKGGPACSNCPEGFKYCINGLCSQTEVAAAPSPSTASRPLARFLLITMVMFSLWSNSVH